MSNELATTGSFELVEALANEVGMSRDRYWVTLQEMAGCPEASESEFFGLCMQAKKLGLDPLQRQLYLMKTKKGVQVVVPIDGYITLMLRHPNYLHHESREMVVDNKVVAITAIIHTKSQHAAGLPPTEHTEYMAECEGNSGPWRSHPIRMLKHKAFSQAVRYCFGVYVPDENEWARAADVAPQETKRVPVDVTPAVEMTGMSAGGDEVEADHAVPAAPSEAESPSTDLFAGRDEEPPY